MTQRLTTQRVLIGGVASLFATLALAACSVSTPPVQANNCYTVDDSTVAHSPQYTAKCEESNHPNFAPSVG